MADAAEQFARFKTLIATSEPPALGPQRRAGTLGVKELNGQLTAFFERENIPAAIQPFLKSAALLWHDHLDASHEISQNIHTPEGSWLHGIMHRREPDYENAKYWFQRVGNHEAYRLLTERAARNQELLKAGQWDSFAFIDACEKAEQGDDPAAVSILQQVQVTEFETLVAYVFQHT
jgi:hypothetical protein